MTTYNEVIPQNLQNELIAIRDSISQNFWDIGDISLMVCNYVDDNDIPVSRDFVWRAVGAFVGLSARTVREYARVARFFNYAVRKEYEILTFSHFAFAARYEEHWKQILDFAIAEIENLGRPATVDRLEVEFTYGNKEYTPEEHQDILPQPRGNIFLYVNNIRSEVERITLMEEYRNEIKDHLNAIERLLQFVTA